MVLESILNPRNAEDKPSHVFAIAFVYTFIAVFFAEQLFPQQSSMLAIALITIIFIPFFQQLFEIEEKTDIEAKGNIFARHAKSISVFSAFFLGVTFAMTFLFVFFHSASIFELQTATIKSISGYVVNPGDFMKFLVNNTKVMLLVFALSVMFGAGAIFILTWNASVIAVYLGLVAQPFVSKLGASGVLLGVPVGLGGIILHGIPEIFAYFVAGLAGGILSVSVIRENVGGSRFRTAFADSLMFLAAAEALIIVAAFIEAA